MMVAPEHDDYVTSITYGEGDLITIWRAAGRKQVMQPVPEPRPLNIAKAEKPFSFWLGAEGHWGYDG